MSAVLLSTEEKLESSVLLSVRCSSKAAAAVAGDDESNGFTVAEDESLAVRRTLKLVVEPYKTL